MPNDNNNSWAGVPGNPSGSSDMFDWSSIGLGGSNKFSNIDDYKRAYLAWEAGGRKGLQPYLSEGGDLQLALARQGYASNSPEGDPFQRLSRDATGVSVNGASPFYTANADQSREGQLALLQQMQRNAQGPSLAGMQGQQALGRLGATAAGQAAMGNSRAALLGARSASAGMGFDTAQARLQEALRARAGVGGAAGGIRGADIRTQDTAARMGLQSMQNQLSNRLAFAGLGARQANIQDQARLELFKAAQRADMEKKAKDVGKLTTSLGAIGTVVGGLV